MLILGGVTVLALAMALPVLAITRGEELDVEEHPYVGLMVALDANGDALWRCSGTLIDSTTYVTAGHCTEPPAVKATIWFDTDVESGIPANGYPTSGDVDGTAFLHPDYNPAAFFLYDLGVVKLDTPVIMSDYASLPTDGFVDTLGNGRRGAAVTAVGYGLQASSANPLAKHADKTQADRVRYQADLFIVNTNGAQGVGGIKVPPGDLPPNSMTLSGDAKHGGTCFGDSGGPIFDGDVLLAVTSYRTPRPYRDTGWPTAC
jgi:hypothetical protein